MKLDLQKCKWTVQRVKTGRSSVMKLDGLKEQNLSALWNVSEWSKRVKLNGFVSDWIDSDRPLWLKWPSSFAQDRIILDRPSAFARPSTLRTVHLDLSDHLFLTMTTGNIVYVISSLYLRQCYPRSWLFAVFVLLKNGSKAKNNSRDKCIYAVLHLYHFYEKNENVKSPFNFELGGRPCGSIVYTCMNI